ncbi:MAG: prefoldin subunit [Candidatus Pacearchaeota archaeon]
MSNEKNNQTIQEIQMLEQNLQNLLYQKQAFQMEISETEAAKKEVESSEEIFKIVGQLMIKTDKDKIKKEILDKDKLLKLRVESIEKQESAIAEKIEELKKLNS